MSAQFTFKWKHSHRQVSPAIASSSKGSRLSQKALAEVMREVEDRRAREKLHALETALDYKLKWKGEIERCQKLGIEVSWPIPNPEEIVINVRTGDVKTHGPQDEREKPRRTSASRGVPNLGRSKQLRRALPQSAPDGRQRILLHQAR